MTGPSKQLAKATREVIVADSGPVLAFNKDDLRNDVAADVTEATPLRLGIPGPEFQAKRFPIRTEVIRGITRGEKGLLNAVTNGGKSTLIRNLGLSLVTGRPFQPLYKGGEPMRVALLDFETDPYRLQTDLQKMLGRFHHGERAFAWENILIFPALDRAHKQKFTLSDPDILMRTIEEIHEFNADLTIVDTISRAFQIRNESENSEVIDKVMEPLEMMAVAADTAILAVHHIGKSKAENGSVREAAHRGRGASAFSDQSIAIYNLDRDRVNDRTILSNAKIKGEEFDDTVLYLSRDNRWFERAEVLQPGVTNYEAVMGLFEQGTVLKTGEVITALKGRVTERTAKERLKEAVRGGQLMQPRRGMYSLPSGLLPE